MPMVPKGLQPERAQQNLKAGTHQYYKLIKIAFLNHV